MTLPSVSRAVVVSALLVSVGVASCSRSSGPRRTVTAARAPIAGAFGSAGASLSFRLDLPDTDTPPYPAIVIGHGSGEVRKEACRSLAGAWIRRGFGVLCYDKRGVGESGGVYRSVGLLNSHELIPELARDMAAAVEYLRDRGDVDPQRIGLMGGSQAGWVIPQAARLSKAAFTIVLVGPAVTVGEEIYFSKFAEETTTPLSKLADLLTKYDGPRGFDPQDDLEANRMPGLWLLAGADRSIPTPESVAVLDALIIRGKPYVRKVYPGADHGLHGINIWPDVDDFLARRVGFGALR
jgi:dienelactone hydrolase